MVEERSENDLAEPFMCDPGRVGQSKGENSVMRHLMVRKDPASDRDMQIGVGIVQDFYGMADDHEIRAKAEERGQRDAKTAAIERQRCAHGVRKGANNQQSPMQRPNV